MMRWQTVVNAIRRAADVELSAEDLRTENPDARTEWGRLERKRYDEFWKAVEEYMNGRESTNGGDV